MFHKRVVINIIMQFMSDCFFTLLHQSFPSSHKAHDGGCPHQRSWIIMPRPLTSIDETLANTGLHHLTIPEDVHAVLYIKFATKCPLTYFRSR